MISANPRQKTRTGDNEKVKKTSLSYIRLCVPVDFRMKIKES